MCFVCFGMPAQADRDCESLAGMRARESLPEWHMRCRVQ